MGDNKDLLDEIDQLDDNEGSSKGKNEEENSHEKIFTIIIIIIIIAALVMLYLFYKGIYIVSNKTNIQDGFSSYLNLEDYQNNNDNDENEDNLNEDEDIEFEDNVNYELLEKQALEKFESQKPNLNITNQILDINNKLIAVLHNGNQENISDVLVQVIFYNEQNVPIKIDEWYINGIEANEDYYINFEGTPKQYSRCDFLISKEFLGNKLSHKSDITFSVVEEERILKIKGKNNSNSIVSELEFSIIYYNEENKIIGLETIGDYEVEANSEFELEFEDMLYSEQTDTVIPCARYEVLLSEAVSYEEII